MSVENLTGSHVEPIPPDSPSPTRSGGRSGRVQQQHLGEQPNLDLGLENEPLPSTAAATFSNTARFVHRQRYLETRHDHPSGSGSGGDEEYSAEDTDYSEYGGDGEAEAAGGTTTTPSTPVVMADNGNNPLESPSPSITAGLPEREPWALSDLDAGDDDASNRTEPAASVIPDGGALPDGSIFEYSSLEEGLKVEVRYRGKNRYFPGVVRRVHGDGVVDIRYNDGEVEKRVAAALVEVALHDGKPGKVWPLPWESPAEKRRRLARELKARWMVRVKAEGATCRTPPPSCARTATWSWPPWRRTPSGARVRLGRLKADHPWSRPWARTAGPCSTSRSAGRTATWCSRREPHRWRAALGIEDLGPAATWCWRPCAATRTRWSGPPRRCARTRTSGWRAALLAQARGRQRLRAHRRAARPPRGKG